MKSMKRMVGGSDFGLLDILARVASFTLKDWLITLFIVICIIFV